MQRREFVTAALATSAALATPPALARSATSLVPGIQAEMSTPAPREYYQLLRFSLQSGPQTALTESYFGDALIPALTRLGFGPVGAFRVDVGPETPTFYLLVPGPSVERLAEMDQLLAKDAEFLKAGHAFWNAPATAPPFHRIESSLLSAFAGWPKLTPPAGAATHAKRIFQLRIYESATHFDHVRKVEMFHDGEFAIFEKAGLRPVFFGDTLVGPRTPNLTYMLSFNDMAELDAKWAGFAALPEWKKLKSDPRYSYAEIVSNISNLMLSPLACSQI